MEKIKASILTIGDELLIGQVIDTNSAFIAQELNAIGIDIVQRVAVGDAWDDMWQALDEEQLHADIVLITGGLGPTSDDITKPLLCEYFQTELIQNEEALANLQKIFRNRTLAEKQMGQALLPKACTPIPNTRGTAFGMWFERNGKIIISMPGVPFEMKGMITDFVVPQFKQKLALPTIGYRYLLTGGLGESAINDRIQTFEDQLPKGMGLAYLPDLGKVRLRLTLHGDNLEEVNRVLDEEFAKMKALLPDVIISDNGDSTEVALGKLLKSQNLTVATAESCTAGNIAHTISSVPGASQYLLGGVVAYSNQVKHEILHVKSETLENFGAVSEQTVREMVQGTLNIIHSDYAIAVSGILGPDGGSDEKPVGTVWIAVGTKENITTKKFQFRHNRERNMQLTTNHALNMFIQILRQANA